MPLIVGAAGENTGTAVPALTTTEKLAEVVCVPRLSVATPVSV